MTTEAVQQTPYFAEYTERPDPLGIPRSASKLKVVSKAPKQHDASRQERPPLYSVSTGKAATAGKTLLQSGSTESTLVPVDGRVPSHSASGIDFQSKKSEIASSASEEPLHKNLPVDTKSSAGSSRMLHRSSSTPSVSTSKSATSVSSDIDGQGHGRKGIRPPELKLDPDSASPEGILTIEDIMRKHKNVYKPTSMPTEPVPAIPAKFKVQGDKILSIDEIIRNNKTSLLPPRYNIRAGSAPPDLQPDLRRKRLPTGDSESSQARSSIDSITDEVLSCLGPRESKEVGRKGSHSTLQTPNSKRPDRQRSLSSTSSSKSFGELRSFTSDSGTPAAASEDTLRYLRSARLTRLLQLRKPPNHHLTVSLADVGLDTGHPVLVCLGLGCVRYLVALYDELAAALGLRLICIDRWGLGRSDDVPEAQRSFSGWAAVVDEVLEQLGLTTCSIVAHSAGAPYALAVSTRLGSRIHGSIHLLAPWIVNPAENASANYKWLKYVPSGVLKAAHTAEWKVQGWKLGKSSSSKPGGLGFDPRAPISSDMVSPVLAEFPAEDSDEEGETSLRCPSPTPTRTSTKTSTSTSTRGASRLANTRHGYLKSPSPTSGTGDKDLVTALLRASHSESLRGSTADLLCILNRSSSSNVIHYNEVTQPIKVWHGARDEKITLASVKVLESLVSKCEIRVVPGADHSLMTNVPVFTEALRSIASEVS